MIIMRILKIKEMPNIGFSIPSRFFICLAPIGIIATAMCSIEFVRLFKNNKWMLLNIIIAFGALLIMRALRTFIRVFDWGLY